MVNRKMDVMASSSHAGVATEVAALEEDRGLATGCCADAVESDGVTRGRDEGTVAADDDAAGVMRIVFTGGFSVTEELDGAGFCKPGGTELWRLAEGEFDVEW